MLKLLRSTGWWSQHAGNILIQAHKDLLLRPFTSDEVKSVMFSMDGNRALGSDGFGSFYLKKLGILWEGK